MRVARLGPLDRHPCDWPDAVVLDGVGHGASPRRVDDRRGPSPPSTWSPSATRTDDDRAVVRRADRVLHLHRLEHHEHVARGDRVTLRDCHARAPRREGARASSPAPPRPRARASRGTSASTHRAERPVDVDASPDAVERRPATCAAVELCRRPRRRDLDAPQLDGVAVERQRARRRGRPVIAHGVGRVAAAGRSAAGRPVRRCAIPRGSPRAAATWRGRSRRCHDRRDAGESRASASRAAAASAAARATVEERRCRSRPRGTSSLAGCPTSRSRLVVTPWSRAARSARRAAARRPRASAPTRSPWRASRRSSSTRPSPCVARVDADARRPRGSRSARGGRTSGRYPASASSA